MNSTWKTRQFTGIGMPETWPYMHFSFTSMGVLGSYVPSSPWTHRPNIAGKYCAWSKLPWNHNLPQGRPRLWERQHPKLDHIRDFDSTVRRVYELYEQNTLGPTDLIWLVHTVWGPNCCKIIICHTPNLAIYASFNSTAGDIWALCTK